MIFLLFINIFLLAQNFIYDSEDWIVVTNPGKIMSMSYSNEHLYIVGLNGVFTVDKNNSSLLHLNEFLNIHKGRNLLIHYDNFRNYIWFSNDRKIYFKSSVSSIWREIDKIDIGVSSLRSLENIGSDADFIYLKFPGEYICLNPYVGIVENCNEDINNTNQLDNVVWSTSLFDINPYNLDVTSYYSSDNYTIISQDIMEKNNNHIYINGVIQDNQNNFWLGTSTGEVFKGDSYTRRINVIENIPLISNIGTTYLDDYGEWWFSNNNFVDLNNHFILNNTIFLSRWIEQNNQWDYYHQDKFTNIHSFDITKIYRYRNKVYVGTKYGCLFYELNKNNWKILDSLNKGNYSVNDIEFYNNNIYLATDKGMQIFSYINDIIVPNKNLKILNNQFIYSLEIYHNKLFIGTEKGIFIYNIKDNVIDKISDNIIYDFESDSLNVYGASKNKIYNINDPNKRIYNKKNINNFCICSDYAWINLKNEAILLNIETKKTYSYSYLDGIGSRNINYIGCDDEWAWFSTDKGLILYNWSKYHASDK